MLNKLCRSIFTFLIYFSSFTAYSSSKEKIDVEETGLFYLPSFPSSKLTFADVDNLKQVWTELNPPERIKGVIQNFFNTSLAPPLGWVTSNELDELRILCYIDQKNWKNNRDLEHQVKIAASRLCHLAENLAFLVRVPIARAKRYALSDKLGTGLLPATHENELKLAEALSGLHSANLPADFTEFPSLVALQKMMRNLVYYCEKVFNYPSNHLLGSILPLADKFMLLGYIKNYIPIVVENMPGYNFSYLPYQLYSHPLQCGILMQDSKIVEEIGLVIKDDEVYNLSWIKKAFIYQGSRSELPFTISPFELKTDLLRDEASKSSSEILFKKILEEEYPGPKQTSFIPLPDTEYEKNMVEIFFLEGLRNQPATDEYAHNLIRIIEEDTSQSLTAIIEGLTQQQQEIMQEQMRISQQVVAEEIPGRLKSKKGNLSKVKKHSLASPFQQPPKAAAKGIALTERFQEEIKSKRVKYRKFLRVINKAIKIAPPIVLTEGTKGGSHKTIHSETGVATVVRLHGKKDNSISVSSLRRFYEKFTSFLKLS